MDERCESAVTDSSGNLFFAGGERKDKKKNQRLREMDWRKKNMCY